MSKYQPDTQCTFEQGQHTGNCFKWALERILSKIVFSMIYPNMEINYNITYPTHESLQLPIYKNQTENDETQANYMRTRVGLTLFFGEWIDLYCGAEGVKEDAFKDIDKKKPITDEDVFTNETITCEMNRRQKYTNAPEVLFYNFSRIVNFIIDDVNNIETHLDLLLNMRYPICFGVNDPTLDAVNAAASHFNTLKSGYQANNILGYDTYAGYVREALNSFIVSLKNNNEWLDVKSVTLHRKQYVLYNNDELRVVPEISKSQNNVKDYSDIKEQLDKSLYAELSIHVPNNDTYLDWLEKLTQNRQLRELINSSITTRRGNVAINNAITSLRTTQVPDLNTISGHSMALRNITVCKDKNNVDKLCVMFINSWDNQDYVEYPVDIFLRADVNALIIVKNKPDHIRDIDIVDLQEKYMEISLYVPSLISDEILKKVIDKTYNQDPYHVDNVDDSSEPANMSVVDDYGNDNYSNNNGNPDYLSSHKDVEFHFKCLQRYVNNNQIIAARVKLKNYSPYVIDVIDTRTQKDETPMEVCTKDKCGDYPIITLGKRKSGEVVVPYNKTPPNNAWSVGNKGGKPKTNKRRAKPRKRVTRKLKKKRATCRMKPCRILKRRTYKRK